MVGRWLIAGIAAVTACIGTLVVGLVAHRVIEKALCRAEHWIAGEFCEVVQVRRTADDVALIFWGLAGVTFVLAA